MPLNGSRFVLPMLRVVHYVCIGSVCQAAKAWAESLLLREHKYVNSPRLDVIYYVPLSKHLLPVKSLATCNYALPKFLQESLKSLKSEVATRTYAAS